jgi:hypothetical protein
MVISYNQNLYFKIQFTKSKNRIVIQFFIFLIRHRIHTKYEYENTTKTYNFLFTKNFNQNIVTNSMFY